MTDIDVLQIASDLVVGGREGGMVVVGWQEKTELCVIDKELGRI